MPAQFPLREAGQGGSARQRRGDFRDSAQRAQAQNVALTEAGLFHGLSHDKGQRRIRPDLEIVRLHGPTMVRLWPAVKGGTSELQAQKGVVVIPHQHIGMRAPTRLGACLTQTAPKRLAVLIMKPKQQRAGH